MASQSLLKLKTGEVGRCTKDLLDKLDDSCFNTINPRDNVCIVRDGRIIPPGLILPSFALHVYETVQQ